MFTFTNFCYAMCAFWFFVGIASCIGGDLAYGLFSILVSLATVVILWSQD